MFNIQPTGAMKIINGNRSKISQKVGHCSLGSKKWENKVITIQNMVDDLRPDLCFITESNIMGELPDYKTRINGYIIVKPLKERKIQL